MKENFKSGFTAIIGRPNVGKSTLMNHLIGQKIAITSKKPQTTRNRIQTVYTCDDGQIVFLDTPGIHKAKNKLGEYMVQVAERTLKDVDVILWLVEPTTFIGAGERHIAEQLQGLHIPVILVINKVDTVDKDEILKAIDTYRKLYDFDEIIPCSALRNQNTEDIIPSILKYLPYGPMFYDEDTINAVMSSNRVDEIQEDTDTNAIVIGVNEKEENSKPQEKVYENEYEKAILEKENPDDTYKIIEINGKGYSGYLAAIYDPSKVKTLVTAKIGTSGQYLTTMAKNNKAVVAINGGGFDDPNYSSNAANPLGITYSRGKLVTSYYYAGAGGIIGFDTSDKLVLSSKCTEQSAKSLKIRDAVTCGPFLIVNGKKSSVVGNGGWGTAPRTAIGQRKDGIVLFLVVDGRTVKRPGADMDDLIEIMENYGAYNAANLDGGTSTAMTVDYKLINDPVDSTGAHKTRFISTGFGLIE